MNKAVYINSIDEWERIKSAYKSLNEIIIFKFSPICAQSLDIEREVIKWFQKESTDNTAMVCINVISNRFLSMSIAFETGVAHESPQIIWLNKEGKVKFTASHRKIDPDELSQLLNLV